MALVYRVTLQGLKGFARVYEVKPEMTLYEFHNVMRTDMDFPQDQLFQFKALDETGSLVARYSTFDLGYGTVDEVTVAQTVEKGVASFIYFYDVTNKKNVIVTYEGEVEDDPKKDYPYLDASQTKGPNPIEFENGYVAYEDLPEDQKHPPHHEPIWGKGAPTDDGDEDFDDDDEDLGDDEDFDDEDEDEEDDEDGKEIFDEDEGGF